MFRRESDSDSSSENYNFDYQIDITQKKEKTGSIFNREDGFEFDDFQNMKDDKTNKSEKTTNKKILSSEVWKKSEQSSLIPPEHMIDLDRKKLERKGDSMMDQERQFESIYEKSNYMRSYKSPKFALHSGQIKPYQTISEAITGKYQDEQTVKIPEEDQQYFKKHSMKKDMQDQRKEDLSYGIEDEYMDLCSKIKYYEQQSEKLDYQGSKLIESMKFIQGELCNPLFDSQFKKTSEQTHVLNNQIEEQRSIEKCLVDTLKNLEEQFEKLSNSINSMQFKRQKIIRDDSKALLEEINCLKSDFQSLKRDDGSLNLSLTIQNPAGCGMQQEKLQSQAVPAFSPEQIFFNQFVQEIKQQQRKSGDPKYLYNIKMLFFKQQWTIFNNSDICVNVSYRKFPKIQLRIGNKTLKQIEQIKLYENGAQILNGILGSKSFYVHFYNSAIKAGLTQPFGKFQISYKKQNYIKLFIPTTILQLGQFIPLTIQQYLYEKKFHQNTLFQTRTTECPIDKSLINTVQECSIYYPNLLQAERECFGIWKGEGREGAIVRIWQNAELVGVQTKGNQNQQILGKCLLFLFSR